MRGSQHKDLWHGCDIWSDAAAVAATLKAQAPEATNRPSTSTRKLRRIEKLVKGYGGRSAHTYPADGTMRFGSHSDVRASPSRNEWSAGPVRASAHERLGTDLQPSMGEVDGQWQSAARQRGQLDQTTLEAPTVSWLR